MLLNLYKSLLAQQIIKGNKMKQIHMNKSKDPVGDESGHGNPPPPSK